MTQDNMQRDRSRDPARRPPAAPSTKCDDPAALPSGWWMLPMAAGGMAIWGWLLGA